MISPGGPYVPRIPRIEDLCIPKLPDPPLLEDLDDVETAELLVRLYRGLIEARTKERCPILSKRGSVSSYRGFADLVKAGRTFREHEIAPAGWIAFSWDVWYGYVRREKSEPPADPGKAKRRRPPALGWTYLPSRIVKHRGWYRRESGSYGGGRLLISAEQHKLIELRAQLEQQALWDTTRLFNRSEGQVSQSQLTELLSKLQAEYFPFGFQAMIEQVKVGGERQSKRLSELIKEGRFVW